MGIIICGLNGVGKSTIGKALAEKLSYEFIDVESMYIPDPNSPDSYLASRKKGDVIRLLEEKICKSDRFIFVSVQGNYGDMLMEKTKYVIYVETPKEVRMERVKVRQREKFGDKLTDGSDLALEEADWLSKVEKRTDEYVTAWFKEVTCPIITADGTRPIEETVEYLLSVIKE